MLTRVLKSQVTIFIAVVFAFVLPIVPMSAERWAGFYGGPANEVGHALVETGDGGFVFVGPSDNAGGTSWELAIVKVDGLGNILWQKLFGDGSEGKILDYRLSVAKTAEGGCIVVGHRTDAAAGRLMDFWVILLNGSGDILWQKIYGGTAFDWAASVVQSPDGGFAVLGTTYSFGSGQKDILLIKLSPAGEIQWQKAYGGAGNDTAAKLALSSDGGFCIAGFTYSYGMGQGDGWVIKTDSAGAIKWQKSFGGTNFDFFNSISGTADGGYILAGTTQRSGVAGYEAWVLKLDSLGQRQWEKAFGGSSLDMARSAIQVGDGYVVVGNTASYSMETRGWVLRLDGAGAPLIQRAYGWSGLESSFLDVISPASGGLATLGWTKGYGSGLQDAWLMRLDDSGLLGADCVTMTNTTAPGSNPSLTINDTTARAVNSGALVSATSVTARQGSAASQFCCSVYCSATASPSSGAPPLTVTFNASAGQLHCEGAITYHWDFGDGTTADGVQGTTHTYSRAGVYSWKLEVAVGNATCASGGTIEVISPCTLECSASATPASGPAPLSVSFAGQAQGTGCTGQPAFSWSFGDGNSSQEQSPAHIYQAPGSYDWAFTATMNGVSCSQSGRVSVLQPCSIQCSALATPDLGVAPLGVSFSSQVTAAPSCDPNIVYSWTFGDGGSSAMQNAEHTYTAPGTYGWEFRASVGNISCTKSGTVTATGTSGPMSGSVAVRWESGTWKLNGPGIVSGTATVKKVGSSEAYTAPINNGAFTFANLPYGYYQIKAEMTYTDHIPYDANRASYGCPGPDPGTVQKVVTSQEETYNHKPGAQASIVFPPPLVMLHGALACYKKWYSSDPSNPRFAQYWDNDARSKGFISFTPNYMWWGGNNSWSDKADQVAGQIVSDITGLHSAEASSESAGLQIPYVLIGHDMGGLVARVLCSGPHRWESVVDKILRIYMMGTPNSGSDYLLGGGENTLMSTNSIVRRFNEVYPDFGSKTDSVYAIAGNSAWWKRKNGDGRVSIYSAFTITRLSCYEAAPNFKICRPYQSIQFDSGLGHIFNFTHNQLGGPSSSWAILEKVILSAYENGSQVEGAQAMAPVDPESPAGALVWGTNSRTVGTASGSTQGRESSGAPAAQTDYDFTVSQTDGVGVVGIVTDGSATFSILDPNGKVLYSEVLPKQAVEEEEDGFEFYFLDPEPGDWKLRVEPGASGVSFEFSMLENAMFGIAAYTTAGVYAPDEDVVLRVDADGVLTNVLFGTVFADIYDNSGNLLKSVQLFDDGNHQDGSAGDGHYGATTAAPHSEGSYPLIFRAVGTYLGTEFGRVATGRLYIESATALFAGTFADEPLDSDGNGKFDALRFSADCDLPSAGSYAARAELYDAADNFISSASSAIVAGSAGKFTARLDFSLSSSFCEQFGSPFLVRNLELMDGASLATLDAWTQPVETATYQSGDFDCRAGKPSPVVSAVRPNQGVKGQALTLSISGYNFKVGASVSAEPGLAVGEVTRVSSSLLQVSVTVQADALAGPRRITVTNTDGTTGAKIGAFEIMEQQPPEVDLLTPSDGDNLKGTVVVSASASDDVEVKRVEFLVDGVVKAADSDFPFSFKWDTNTAQNGSHQVMAQAFDSSGLSAASSPVTVSVLNYSVPGDCDGNGVITIGEVQKAINMFLGSAAPDCGVDCNGDGVVTIGDIQKVINNFLGTHTEC